MTTRKRQYPWHGLPARGLLLPLLFFLPACGEQPNSAPPVAKKAPIPGSETSIITDALVEANNRGVGLMGSFDYEAAVTHFESLHADFPNNHDVTVNLAIATLNRQREGDEPRALELLNSVLADDPSHLRARYCAALLSLNNGDSAQAVEHFAAVAEAQPDDAFAQYYTGLCLNQTGDADGATERFERAIERNPYLRSAYYGLFQTLQRAGESDRAKEMLDTFQKLAENPKAQLAEFKYTRMGDLAMALAFDNPDAEPVAEADPFRAFGEPIELMPELRRLNFARSSMMPTKFSSIDFDNDGTPDIFIHKPLTPERALEIEKRLDDISVYSLSNLPPIPGSEDDPLFQQTSPANILWGDINNDSKADAYVCGSGPNTLFIQTHDGWKDATDDFGVSGGDRETIDGRLVDADHDGDLDIFLINAGAPNALLNNNRDGTFTDIAPDRGIAGDSNSSPRGVVFADLDHDRDLDIIVLNHEPPHEVYENRLLWEYAPMPGFETFKSTPFASIAVADTDTDGIPEIFTVDGTTMSHWFPQNGEWTNVHNRPVDGSTQVMLFDADNDGVIDILHAGDGHCTLAQLHPSDDTWTLDSTLGDVVPIVLDPTKGIELLAMDGHAPILIPAGPGRQNTLALSLKGAESAADQMRTNFSAIGTTVRARVGSRWSTATNLPNSTSITGQSLTPLSLGLGPAQRADYIEILWPDGVYQTELGLEAGQLHEITETQRQLSSCPVLFAWNGREYAFVSDILGTGGIGFALAPGEYAPSDPTENFLFPEGSIAPKDGAYEIKVGEPMEEVAYLDRVGLLAYDLPPGWRMTLDERMHTGGEFVPTGEPIYYRHATSPARVTNDRDETVTLDVALRDNTAAPLPPLDRRFIGRTAEEHVLTIEFDQPHDARPGKPTLVIDGWVEYPYSQVMFAAWQAGATYEPLTLEALDPATGEWVTLLDTFGYPAGMPRQMSAPMPNLPDGATTIRLRTTLEIYIDRLFIAHAEPCPEAIVTELPLLNATLADVGFPKRVNHPQRRPDYDATAIAPLWDARHPAGLYTALGPCDELLAEKDGALVIMGPGEETRLRFGPTPPSPSEGWTRCLVLTSEGWCKDMDLYCESPNSVEPLPSHPIHENARTLMQRYSTRWMRGK